jgi:hypothetical protein
MKVILSRKGFDLTAGRYPSPILEDGRFVSLPIPHLLGPHRYNEVKFENGTLAKLVHDLTHGRVRGSSKLHLDPDVRREARPRAVGWRPMFGQSGHARAHLRRQEVGTGDRFLFFGWFREVELFSGKYRYKRGSASRHIIFGWLDVQEVWESPFQQPPTWAQCHPHLKNDYWNGSTVYVASSDQTAGAFNNCSDDLVLTEKGRLRSEWLLPGWMHPSGRKSALTYHSDVNRWGKCKLGTRLQSVGRGQEFVLNTLHYPEAVSWSDSLIRKNSA